jgi:hypothetical protein
MTRAPKQNCAPRPPPASSLLPPPRRRCPACLLSPARIRLTSPQSVRPTSLHQKRARAARKASTSSPLRSISTYTPSLSRSPPSRVVVTVLMAAADTSEASAAGLALAEANINWERYAPEIPCPVTEEESFCSCPSVRVGCSDVVIYGEVVWGSDEKWGTGGGTGWFEEPDSRAHWTPPPPLAFFVCLFWLGARWRITRKLRFIWMGNRY